MYQHTGSQLSLQSITMTDLMGEGDQQGLGVEPEAGGVAEMDTTIQCDSMITCQAALYIILMCHAGHLCPFQIVYEHCLPGLHCE